MENKKTKHSYNGLQQDITSSQYQPNFYFDGRNIRINATNSQSTNSVMNEKGNSLILTVPVPIINYDTKIISYNDKTLSYTNDEIDYEGQSGDQIIIGHSNSRKYIILFTTDNAGFDCIWKVDYETYEITLLYLRNLKFSINNPIQTINNFENESIDKVYWVDGVNQMRVINIEHSIENEDIEELIDVSENVINMVGKYNLSEPLITDVVSGGDHTSGMIQYGYNLYRINSSQTRISSLSKLISLDKGVLGGGAVNELIGATPIVNITNIDSNYTHVKVYAIKYTSLNQTPSISLIKDVRIPSNGNLEVFDDGKVISTMSIEEFMFLGSNIIIPKHINTKFNRLFFANYNEINFNVDIDTRAYSYNSAGISTVYSDLRLEGGVPSGDPEKTINIVNDSDYDSLVLDKHDSVNLNYNNFKFQKDGTTFGGEGKYIKYQLTQSLTPNDNNRYFKDDEIYRLGIQFYNNYGQISLPNWIADFKSLNENLKGKFNTLKVTLKPEFFTWLDNTNFTSDYNKPIGYKIIIAERTISDRTIVANGLLSTMMINDKSTKDIPANYQTSRPSEIPYIRTQAKNLIKLPNLLVRNCNASSDFGNVRPLRNSKHLRDMSLNRSGDTEMQRAEFGDKDTAGRFYQFNSMLQLYSPEILFGEYIPLSESLNLKIKGSLSNHINNSWNKNYDVGAQGVVDEAKALNGLSPFYSASLTPIINYPYRPWERGLVCHPEGSEENRAIHGMYYRNYGVSMSNNVETINTLALTNPLTLTVGTDVNSLISMDPGNKRIQIILDVDHQVGEIEYTITPDVVNLTTLYNVKLTSDYQGNNIISSLSGVTGIQSVSYSLLLNYPTETTSTNSIYIIIESLSVFSGNIDVVISDGVIATPEYIEYESLLNPFTIDNTASISGSLFTKSINNNSYNIYGRPEITEVGQQGTNYNNDPHYRYTNSLEGCLTDGDSSWKEDGIYNRKIVSISSWNNKCITFVTGDNDPLQEHWDRPPIENLFTNSGLGGDNNGLIGELVKSDVEIYLGNIYGGNKYEDKRRTNYIEIGEYKKLNLLTPSIDISSPGDTFVNSFKFIRMVKSNSNISQGFYTLEELVECLSETTIDLKNRNDISFNTWDTRFQPTNDEYQKYNAVYSQQSNLIQRRNLDYNIKKINNFDNNVISSKLKSAGELIDSWTDILSNEVLTLDGKHGSINSLTSFNDELYTIQDKAFAFLSISPRVQVTGGDGLAVQLGSGNVLDRYKYISTDSGTLNKWGVIPTSIGVYYYDLLNKSFMSFNGQINNLSDIKGLHSYFITNTELEDLKMDNPLIKKGISSGYDQINKDVFMTFHKDNNPFTISYNELRNQFISFYDYLPSMYISKGLYFITTNPDLKSIYRQYAGNYGNFYGINYPSYIVLNVNPEANMDTVFDNIMYKSEVYLNDIDQPDKTLTGVRLYSEYQDSGLVPIPLILGRNGNLRRKFRDWNAILPRNKGSRERIRNPWVKLLLQFDNNSNYKLILHDVIISYSV